MRKKLVKIRLIFIFTLIITMIWQGTYPSLALSQSDLDNLSNWAKEEVNEAKEIGLIPERIQGDYRRSITREEFSELALMLYEYLSGKEIASEEESPFIDVENPKVTAAYKLGIVKGFGNGEFAPYENITREQISVVLYNTLKAAKPRYDYSNLLEHIFDDYSMISTWAREAVGYLYSIEITNGVGYNNFNPKGNISREESIALANRMYHKVIDTERTSRNGITPSRGSRKREENPLQVKLKSLIAKEMGKPYIWGGTGPNGYDCSGLVYSLFGKLGISLSRTSKTQVNAGTYVAKKDLQYGDIVFFARDGKNINHVGIYVGDGKFVHAPQSGDVVKVTTLMSGYYANGYYTARRVLK